MTELDKELPTQDEYFAQLFNELNAMVTHLEAIQEKYFLVNPSYDRMAVYGDWGCYYDGSEFVITDMPRYKKLKDEKKFTQKYDNSSWTRIRHTKYFLPGVVISEFLISAALLFSIFPNPVPMTQLTAFMGSIIAVIATVILTIVNFPATRKSYKFYSIREFFMTEIDGLEDLRGYHAACKKLTKEYFRLIAQDAPTDVATKIIHNQKFIDALPSLMDVPEDSTSTPNVIDKLFEYKVYRNEYTPSSVMRFKPKLPPLEDYGA